VLACVQVLELMAAAQRLCRSPLGVLRVILHFQRRPFVLGEEPDMKSICTPAAAMSAWPATMVA
jgi:hypothetical protein